MMGWLLGGLGWSMLVLSLAGCGFCLHAAWVLGRYRSTPGATSLTNRPVTLIKPLHGGEAGLESALRTFLTQDYAGAIELRLGVQDAADAALPTAEALAKADARVRVVVDPTEHGGNRKVSNLINIAGATPLSDLVVQSDSDIAVPTHYLAELARMLEEPELGLVTCLYFGQADRPTLAARLGAMFVSYSSLPMFAVGVSLGATPAMGSTLALRRETLEAIGGFAAVKDVLADDYAVGERVRALGLRTAVAPFLVEHRSQEATLGELWRHEVRWSRTVRDIAGAGHAGSIVTHPLPLALLGASLLGFAWPGCLVLAAAFLARLWLKSRVDDVAGVTTGAWWLIPARDILSIAVFAGAWFTQRVDWRGASFHVGRDGALTPV